MFVEKADKTTELKDCVKSDIIVVKVLEEYRYYIFRGLGKNLLSFSPLNVNSSISVNALVAYNICLGKCSWRVFSKRRFNPENLTETCGEYFFLSANRLFAF